MTLRSGLLQDARVALAGAGGRADAIVLRLGALGAVVETAPDDVLGDEAAAAAWMRERAPLRALVFDAGAAFGEGGAAALQATLERAWRAARAAATGALIESGKGGRLVFVGPPAGAGAHAEAARAALENLARTLSVEWARFEVTAVALAPGAGTTAAELAELVAFLVSPAGGYYSGCRFELGAVDGAGLLHGS